jgi:uncharacterized integral membrane protein (TIGR00698 family)
MSGEMNGDENSGTAKAAGRVTLAHFLVPALALLALTPFVSSALALLSGATLALLWGNPYLERTRAIAPRLLAASVVGLGAGMDLHVVARAGLEGLGYTLAGISATIAAGLALGRWLGTDKNTSWLITVGTAICGGSAIAAVAPAIRAKSHEISVALGVVFVLNALALLVFPWIGHRLDLNEAQFGLWSALAIHDTSSVVGATSRYGEHALEIGTTVKLARALWIVPVTFAIASLRSRSASHEPGASRPKRPWFVLGFLAAAAIVTWIPELRPAGHWIERIARQTLVLTLFLIGANLTQSALRGVGLKPFLQGAVLWLLVACASLGWIAATS